MTGEMQLIDTNILVHAYTVSDEKKHRVALPIVEKVWAGEEAATALQNLCEFFFVVTRKVSKPISVTAAEATVEAILASSRWRVIDRKPETVREAIELVKVNRVPFWDALIAASMLEHGINTIVSENEPDFKRVPGISAINPFK
ncbi:MAG: PIN domain-containing protein [Deltaproteobacteria bacterium]|nr:PIN domain-containing protein [Deltaproteobacteria bacterium]